MKKIFWYRILLLLLIVGVGFWMYKYSWNGDDMSILSIDGEKVELVNISPDRGMINSYEVKNVDLWIPNGMGWYPSSRLGLIIKNDVEMAAKISFFNFGFWPKKVVLHGGWNNNKYLWSILGPVGFARYRLSADEWLWKNEILKIDNLGELIPRDMSDNRLMQTDVKITIVNSSGKNGFGNMIADRLEWWGLVVTSVQTRDLERSCQVYFDYKGKEKEIIVKLADILGCNKVNRSGLPEIVLGTDLEEMLKYSQTYVRSF
ncbi:MAG: LytR C-terminal domain-containing protein [Candidatus Shapirobacteria bacterium]